jgi:hypothetical protein
MTRTSRIRKGAGCTPRHGQDCCRAGPARRRGLAWRAAPDGLIGELLASTHAQPLVTAFRDGSARVLELVKENGRTLLDGQEILDEPAWHWPGR